MTNTINRKYKDRLFCSIFKEKKELLSLYNAINGTNYDDEDALTVNTLDNAIYMTMKNDVSFLIYGILNLYEHQSTWNPNMPLRDFLYIAKQIKKIIEERKADLYGSKLVTIPTPQAVVFYNGLDEHPEKKIFKLSDSFENKEKKGCMEFECLVLNVNYGKNRAIMEKCKSLMDYAILLDKIRTYEKQTPSMEEAVERAIKECIDENVLAEYLRMNQSEVTDLILSEYDEQQHIENEKRWSWEEGLEEGRKEVRVESERVKKLLRLLLQENRLDDMEKVLNDEAFGHELMKEYGLMQITENPVK